MCDILVIIKVKDAARIDTAFAKVFVSNSLCYCEFLVSGAQLVFFLGHMNGLYSGGLSAVYAHSFMN